MNIHVNSPSQTVCFSSCHSPKRNHKCTKVQKNNPRTTRIKPLLGEFLLEEQMSVHVLFWEETKLNPPPSHGAFFPSPQETACHLLGSKEQTISPSQSYIVLQGDTGQLWGVWVANWSCPVHCSRSPSRVRKFTEHTHVHRHLLAVQHQQHKLSAPQGLSMQMSVQVSPVKLSCQENKAKRIFPGHLNSVHSYSGLHTQ